VLRLGVALLCAYGVLCLLVFVGQKGLLYFPDRSSEAEALRRAQSLGLAPWRNARGELLGWRAPRSTPAPLRVLIFHGNAGNALDRSPYLALFDRARFDVVLFEYPGYGARPGSLGQEHFMPAAQEAFGLLRQEGPVLLLGESLGSGVAAQVAGAQPAAVSGLLLLTPFVRMGEVGARHYPWLPVKLLLRDRWDSGTALGAFRGPAAILIAGRDEVIGPDQGRRLAAACAGPVRLWQQAEATHNTLDLRPGSPPWNEMLDFVLPR
jgi:pimeloyl-ACP methyl ester carboxylesterase